MFTTLVKTVAVRSIPQARAAVLSRGYAADTASALDFRFDGKRAVVTGAGKGIGYDACVALTKAGAEVIAVTRTQADLDLLVEECGDAIIPALVDISDVEKTTQVLEAAGDIDLVVNNAGIASLQPFLETTTADFDQVMNINLRAALVVSQIAARNMIDRGVSGAIVNVSSQASKVGLVDHASYCASKGALDQLSRVMAVELGPKGIRTNCVNPTVVLTAMGRLAWDAILYLLSDKAGMCNGVCLPIDGGFLTT